MYSLRGAILNFEDLSELVDLTGKIFSLKVIKNQDASKVNYNTYQCIIDIDGDVFEKCISNTILIKIEVLSNGEHLLNIFISPDTFDLINFNDRLNTYKMNVIGPSVIGSRLKNEQQFSTRFNYNQIGNPEIKTTDYANVNIYDFLTETILTNAIESYYGPVKKYIEVKEEFLNTVRFSTINFPNFEDYKVIKTLFWDYLAVLDYPLFSIDDFFIDKSKSIKINLTTLNTIRDKNSSYILKKTQVLNSTNVRITKIINDLPSNEMYKRSIANYTISNGSIPKIDKYDNKVEIPTYPRKDTIALINMESPYYYKISVPLNKTELNIYRNNMQNCYKKFGSTIMIEDNYYSIGISPDIGDKINIDEDENQFMYVYSIEINFVPSGRIADNRYNCGSIYKCLLVDPE